MGKVIYIADYLKKKYKVAKVAKSIEKLSKVFGKDIPKGDDK
tara:strand:- start:632 stop:757 length:126 start_codon:yes stop_codon:yes gene_type:complete